MWKQKKLRNPKSQRSLATLNSLRYEQLELRQLLTVITSYESVSDIPDIPEGDFNKADALFLDGSSSTVVRDENGITAEINTNSLTPGAYTVWIGVFNNPEHCWGACFGDDLANVATSPSIVWGGGSVVDENGVASYEMKLEEGDMTNVAINPMTGTTGPGLVDSYQAEVHLVMRYHGPADADQEIREAQLTTFRGGCDKYECANTQFSIHDPPLVDFTVEHISTLDGDEIDGAYTRLTRFDDRVVMSAVAKDLPYGAYSAWAAIHNDPTTCEDFCSLDQLDPQNRDETTSLFQVGEFHNEEDGANRHFDFAINENDTTQTEFGPGLQDVRTAEIQFFLRYHGQDYVNIDSYDAGCDEFDCVNAYISTHTPLVPGDSNHDLQFDSRDLVAVFNAGKYDSEEFATFEEGDWNRDGFFNSADLVYAMQAGDYLFTARPRVASSIDSVFEERGENRKKIPARVIDDFGQLEWLL